MPASAESRATRRWDLLSGRARLRGIAELGAARFALIGLLHARVSQLTWTNTSDPVTDILAGIEQAEQRARARVPARVPAWPLEFVYKPC